MAGARDNQKVPRSDMDHIHLPDPVKEDIMMLQRENTALCNKVIDLEKQLKELKKDLPSGDTTMPTGNKMERIQREYEDL